MAADNPASNPSVDPSGQGEKARARARLGKTLKGKYRLESMLGIVDPSRPESDGSLSWDDAITEQIRLGDTEVWEIYSSTADAHPIHLHLTSFQVVSRQKFTGAINPKARMNGATGGVLSDVRLRGKPTPAAANERGWKDTVVM